MAFELKDVITISIASLGAGLGILNTWNALDQKRVRLRVIPKLAHPFGQDGKKGEMMGCIEVVNLSRFAVPISEIGFTSTGNIKNSSRFAIGQPITTDHQKFARTLQPHQAVTGYFHLKRLPADIKKAYATTDSGEVTYGSSPAMKQLQDQARG